MGNGHLGTGAKAGRRTLAILLLTTGAAWGTRPRRLTSAELWRVVDRALVAAGARTASAGAARGELSAPVTVEVAEPRLRVITIQAQRSEGVTRFRMIAAGEPRLLPFEVLVRELIALPDGATSWQRAGSGAGARATGLAPRATREDWIVRPSQEAQLTIVDPGFRVTFAVRPLELGAAGETIRVRDRAGRRVLRAKVIGPNRLEIAN